MQHRFPSAPGEGLQVEVTPQTAGWRHLTFRVVGGPQTRSTAPDEEAVVVVLGGSGTLQVGPIRREIRGRADVFDGLPWWAYVPPGTPASFEGQGELAWGSAFGVEPGLPPCICGPKEARVEMRGARNVSRQITHLADPGFARRILAVEVYTPSGNWSSYPPHRHDADRLPEEVDLDEVYYYRMPDKGFAIQRLYDGADLDELILARDRDTVLVRRGYHPVVAGPGYDVYYLNFLAGDHPLWITCDDPELAWVRETWDSRQPLTLPMQP